MTGLALALGIIGFLATVVGGLLTYRGRIREVEPGFYSTPGPGSGWTLALTIVGAVVALAGLIIGLV